MFVSHENTGKSTSTNLDSQDFSNQEDGATSAVNSKNLIFVTGDNSSIQGNTATVNEPSEISKKEWEMAKTPEEEAGDTSSQQPTTQSKSKKKKKKKASKSRENAEMKEEEEGTTPLEGIAHCQSLFPKNVICQSRHFKSIF